MVAKSAYHVWFTANRYVVWNIYNTAEFGNEVTMYYMYVDDSGDDGLENSPTNHFILCGIVVHETNWMKALDEIIQFRRRIRDKFHFKLQYELHAYNLINRPGKDLMHISQNDRFTIYRSSLSQISNMNYLSIVSVVVDKTSKEQDYPVFEKAWICLLQRFQNTLHYRNFNGGTFSRDRTGERDRGEVIPDQTNNKALMVLCRKLRRYNPVPNDSDHGTGYRRIETALIIEDPNIKDSKHSFFIQMADVVAYSLRQKLDPCKRINRWNAMNYFDRLDPVLCKVASRTDEQGIVRL
jgi:hypothetical protein